MRDAEGVLTAPYECVVDLAAGTATVLSEVSLTADPLAMLHVEEQRPGTIVVEVVEDGAVVGRQEHGLRLLVARQWLRVPPVLSLEMLAAFVMPNDPGDHRPGRRGRPSSSSTSLEAACTTRTPQRRLGKAC